MTTLNRSAVLVGVIIVTAGIVADSLALVFAGILLALAATWNMTRR